MIAQATSVWDDVDTFVRRTADRLWPAYRDWVASTLSPSGSPDAELLRRRVTRFFMVAHLLGQRSSVLDIESAGGEISKSNRPLEPPAEAYSLPGNILTLPMDAAIGQFVATLNKSFASSLPDLPVAVTRALRWGDRQAWFITGVEQNWVLNEMANKVLDYLSGRPTSPERFYRESEELLGFTRSRLETVLRTSVGHSVSAGRWEQDQDPVIRSITPLYRYVAIDDGRVRPHHLAFNGFIHDSGSRIWRLINPLNGFNCRCIRESIFLPDAERQGLVSLSDGSLNMDKIRLTWKTAISAGLLTPDGSLTGREVELLGVKDTFPQRGFDTEV